MASLGFKRNSGAALITAIAMLAIFSVLGTAYLVYSNKELDEAEYDSLVIGARSAAAGGIRAAIGELESQISQGAVTGGSFDITIPTYRFDRPTDPKTPLEPIVNEDAYTKVHISVSDECARLNLNHAPVRVLQDVLGIDGDTARNIRSHLPRPDQPAAEAGRRWLASVDDLLDRGLINEAAYERINPDILTVYSVADQSRPEAFINVNTASPEILAAVLGLSLEAAESLAKARPFASVEALGAAAGKDPATFPIKPAEDAPGALPSELCFQSRSFRIVSEATLTRKLPAGAEDTLKTAYAEAVVVFDGNGEATIVFWNESRPVSSRMTESAPAPTEKPDGEKSQVEEPAEALPVVGQPAPQPQIS